MRGLVGLSLKLHQKWTLNELNGVCPMKNIPLRCEHPFLRWSSMECICSPDSAPLLEFLVTSVWLSGILLQMRMQRWWAWCITFCTDLTKDSAMDTRIQKRKVNVLKPILTHPELAIKIGGVRSNTSLKSAFHKSDIAKEQPTGSRGVATINPFNPPILTSSSPMAIPGKIGDEEKSAEPLIKAFPGYKIPFQRCPSPPIALC